MTGPAAIGSSSSNSSSRQAGKNDKMSYKGPFCTYNSLACSECCCFRHAYKVSVKHRVRAPSSHHHPTIIPCGRHNFQVGLTQVCCRAPAHRTHALQHYHNVTCCASSNAQKNWEISHWTPTPLSATSHTACASYLSAPGCAAPQQPSQTPRASLQHQQHQQHTPAVSHT
jgi:hypothetical protein